MPNQTLSSPKADILVIDDTPENLNLLSAMLTQQGYKVRSVTKGSTGIRGAQAAPPDLILLDINMPELNGYQVCEQLKANEKTQEIPVIFISALEDVLDKVKAFAVGGVDYITKPFQIEEVLARIENHLTICNLQKKLYQQNIQLQQEIREREKAEEKFTKAFRLSPNPIAILTLSQRRFVDVNPSFLRMSGYSLEELIGHCASELAFGKDKAAIASLIENLPQTGALRNQEFSCQTRAGEVKIILLSAELIDLGGVPCALLIANDITERKQLENEFISLVSHELRTPLTSLMGAMDLLATGELGTLNSSGNHLLKIATTNTERLIRLVNNILDLERMKTGAIAFSKTVCNLADILIESTEAMQPMAQQANIELITESFSKEIWADSDRLIQTLTNLMNNAIKFSESGSKIWITAQENDNSLLIGVKDQGRGIPSDKLQVIFERFQQVDASDSRTKGGSGLGLAICRHIIEQHDGKIWVESVLGKGSTFYIELPKSS